MIVSPYDWELISVKRGKQTWCRVDPDTGNIQFLERFLEDIPLEQARQERELNEMAFAPNMRPLAVIPDSVVAQSIREGWHDDDKKWKQWMNDIDNRYLRVSDGTA